MDKQHVYAYLVCYKQKFTDGRESLQQWFHESDLALNTFTSIEALEVSIFKDTHRDYDFTGTQGNLMEVTILSFQKL